jgi:SAM-dependent methyltransferase
MTAQTPKTKEQMKFFWNERAKTFPRFNNDPDSYENGMLALARSHGVDFRGRTILDVSAGSGMYTLKLAKEAHSVTALDISDEMLRISSKDAEANGLANISYVLSDWMDYDSQMVFDIVFCSMSPAISDDPSRQKLLNLAGEFMVFAGFAKYEPAGPFSALLKDYSLVPRSIRGGLEMIDYLDRMSIEYSSLEKSGVWIDTRTEEEMISYAMTTLLDYGVKGDPYLIKKCVHPFRNAHTGLYECRSTYTAELIVCPR